MVSLSPPVAQRSALFDALRNATRHEHVQIEALLRLTEPMSLARYTAILASNDAGEPPRRGGLLVAQHGSGYWVYSALAFFRQLPAGVPGPVTARVRALYEALKDREAAR